MTYAEKFAEAYVNQWRKLEGDEINRRRLLASLDLMSAFDRGAQMAARRIRVEIGEPVDLTVAQVRTMLHMAKSRRRPRDEHMTLGPRVVEELCIAWLATKGFHDNEGEGSDGA